MTSTATSQKGPTEIRRLSLRRFLAVGPLFLPLALLPVLPLAGLVILIVGALNLEVTLWMLTNRTYLRSLLADNNVTAVAAFPDHVLVL